MDVRGVGAGPAPISPAAGIGGPAAPKSTPLAQPTADIVTGLLRELDETQLVKLLEWIERPPFPETAARVEEMVRLVAEGKVTVALERLAEFAPLDPQRAERLPSEPEFASLRAQAESLLLRLTAVAHLDARTSLAHAEQTTSGAAPKPDIQPEAALQLANRLLEAGGYANAMTALHVAQVLMEQYNRVGKSARQPARIAFPLWDRTRRLWKRAPLLVLLLGWLAFGLVACLLLLLLASPLAADSFELWGMGFLILVAFGFYMRIRNIRFR